MKRTACFPIRRKKPVTTSSAMPESIRVMAPVQAEQALEAVLAAASTISAIFFQRFSAAASAAETPLQDAMRRYAAKTARCA